MHARLPPASRLLPHNPYTHATYSHIIGSGGGFGSRLAPLSPRLFVWQAWPLATSKCALHGRRGTWRQRRAFCVAGVALMALVGSGRALGSRLAPLSGRQAVRQAGRQTDRQIDTCIHTYIPSVSAKDLLQIVRSHDGLRGLLDIAHAAKTGGCRSPLLMVLAHQLWLHNMITHHLSTTLVHTTL